ncbi:hypothetical protein [Trichloromonas sp.]|uniref:hypothetical protein n=1 Tax=Trichloromonas sp. TaxID=3069249 RepID=UPI002A407755|nr:hypothetical protein [Trichloromonas sp.]
MAPWLEIDTNQNRFCHQPKTHRQSQWFTEKLNNRDAGQISVATDISQAELALEAAMGVVAKVAKISILITWIEAARSCVTNRYDFSTRLQ